VHAFHLPARGPCLGLGLETRVPGVGRVGIGRGRGVFGGRGVSRRRGVFGGTGVIRDRRVFATIVIFDVARAFAHVHDVACGRTIFVDVGVADDRGIPQVEPQHGVVGQDDEGRGVEQPRQEFVRVVRAITVAVLVPVHQADTLGVIVPAVAIGLTDTDERGIFGVEGHRYRVLVDPVVHEVAVDGEGGAAVAVVHHLHRDCTGLFVDVAVAVVVDAVVADLDATRVRERAGVVAVDVVGIAIVVVVDELRGRGVLGRGVTGVGRRGRVLGRGRVADVFVVDHAIAVVVDRVADFLGVGVDGRNAVVAVGRVGHVARGLVALVARLGRVTVAVGIDVGIPAVAVEQIFVLPVGETVTVVVELVADFLGVGVDVRVGVVAVLVVVDVARGLRTGVDRGADVTVAVGVGVVVPDVGRTGVEIRVGIVGEAIAVVVDHVADLVGVRVDVRIGIVAVDVIGEAVAVFVDGLGGSRILWGRGVRIGVAVGVRVGIRVRVGVRVGIRVGVRVGIRVRVGVGVAVGVAVGIRVGVGVRVGIRVRVGVGVGVGIRVGVRVGIRVRVGVGVGIRVGVGVRVGIRVRVGVAVCVRVGVAVGLGLLPRRNLVPWILLDCSARVIFRAIVDEATGLREQGQQRSASQERNSHDILLAGGLLSRRPAWQWGKV
jgi:hypothetical protein